MFVCRETNMKVRQSISVTAELCDPNHLASFDGEITEQNVSWLFCKWDSFVLLLHVPAIDGKIAYDYADFLSSTATNECHRPPTSKRALNQQNTPHSSHLPGETHYCSTATHSLLHIALQYSGFCLWNTCTKTQWRWWITLQEGKVSCSSCIWLLTDKWKQLIKVYCLIVSLLFEGEVMCEPPNNKLDRFCGTLYWREKKYPLTNQNMLLRGCVLRNTEACYGLVIFAGVSASVFMSNVFLMRILGQDWRYACFRSRYQTNAEQRSHKVQTHKHWPPHEHSGPLGKTPKTFTLYICRFPLSVRNLVLNVNFIEMSIKGLVSNISFLGIFQIFGFLVCMGGILAVGNAIWEKEVGFLFQSFLPWDPPVDNFLFSAFLSFWSYVIILNTVVPISLYVR